MYKFYRRDELKFALVWILFYVVGASITDIVSQQIGIEKLLTFLFHTGMGIFLLQWLSKYDLWKEYGLCRSNSKAKQYLYYIPLVFLASCNLWFGVSLQFPIHEALLYIGSMLWVGLLEELIFRGFLFKAMARDGVRSAILISSITFGIGHIINLVNGSGADLVSNLCQVVSAIAFGYLFVIIFYRDKTLIPCIIVHSVINALSAFAKPITAQQQIISAIVLTLVASIYSIYLDKKLYKM